MRSLARLLLVVLVLGTAIRQEWFAAGLARLARGLGLPMADPIGDPGILHVLVGLVRALPEPWHMLVLVPGAMLGVFAAVFVIRAVVGAALRVTGWVRDVTV